ncbi:MAG: prolyl aminopeptidase [Chloroflexota bacterium]
MYPHIEPYAHGMLAVTDGHQLYWEQCGNPQGKPVVVLHGGPGSGCTPAYRQNFDPAAYCITLFDQRGCGRSTPHVADYETDLSVITTHLLVADIERLRTHLDVERWLVYGASWGATLAQVYAQTHPDRVTEIVLTAVTTTTREEINWLYRGVSPLYPALFEAFQAGVPEAERDGDLVAAYYRLLQSPDPEIRVQAALNWNRWENGLVSIDLDAQPTPSRLDLRFQMGFARTVTHFFHHNAWLEEGYLLKNAHRLAHIPAVLINGRFDMAGPLKTAYHLNKAWPGSELVVVAKAGHSAADPGMGEAIIAATDRFRGKSFDRS